MCFTSKTSDSNDSVLLYLTGQVLQPDFSYIGDGAQAVPLRTFPLIDGLSVDGVPQLLFALRSLVLV